MGVFKASAGQVDLQPPVGGWMTGFAARINPTVGTHDPIRARALLLDDGATSLAIVSCDLIGFTPAAVAAMRQRIAARSGIPADRILIACTHTHSGPASMPFRGPAMGHVDEIWLSGAQDRLVDLVCRLPAGLQPARFCYGAADVPGIGYNRQDQAHAIDTELGMIAVDAVDGTAIATLLNYATHSVVLGPANLLYSADYPGEAADQIAAIRGGVGLFLQGTCGDVDPVVYRDRGWGTGTFSDTRDIGGRLADAALDAYGRAWRTERVTLSAAQASLEAPLDPPPSLADLEETAAGLERDRQAAVALGDRQAEWVALAMLDWARDLRAAVQAGTVARTLRAELFLAAINNVCLVAVPFEPYSDIGLAIKHQLAPWNVMVAGYANGLLGYCPTAWAKAQGGYGPDGAARWFPEMLTAVGYGADELIARESARLAQAWS